jgi:hypothetical protein
LTEMLQIFWHLESLQMCSVLFCSEDFDTTGHGTVESSASWSLDPDSLTSSIWLAYLALQPPDRSLTAEGKHSTLNIWTPGSNITVITASP